MADLRGDSTRVTLHISKPLPHHSASGLTIAGVRVDPDIPGKVVTCTPHWDSFAGGDIHHTVDRYLSVRERMRLQSLPDCFSVCGSIHDMYKQVGNAVPYLLARAIAEEIRQVL